MINLLQVNSALETMTISEILHKVWDLFSGSKALSVSTQIEDVILMDYIIKEKLPCRFYTLDTGRLHEETYKMMDKLKFYYKIDLEVYSPNSDEIRELTQRKGLFSFKLSVANRKECCEIRKIHPNQKALKDVKIWLNGMRRSQSSSREDIDILSYDQDFKLYKCSPLANWSNEQMWSYAKKEKLYIHPLYNKQFLSIGCEPCTRSIQAGEDERAGRWWWESIEVKECGLHNS